MNWKAIKVVAAVLCAAGFGVGALVVGDKLTSQAHGNVKGKDQVMEGKQEIITGRLASIEDSWFQGDHRQRGIIVVANDKSEYALYFGPEMRDARIKVALTMDGSKVAITGRVVSQEQAAKLLGGGNGKARRVIEVIDIRFGTEIEPERAVRVPVVLRVKWLRGGAAKAIAMEEVEVLEVLKNSSGQAFEKALLVGRANIQKNADLPLDPCTIYLQETQDALNNRIWTLLNLNLDQRGVSHVGTPAANVGDPK